MSDEFDPFAGGTGLKAGRATIIDAYFQHATGNNTNLNLIVKKDFGDGEPTEDRYGCGGDWITPDGGETAEHPKGARTLFNSQTAYHKLIRGAIAAGAENVLRERSDKEYGGRGPMHARSWVGLDMEWEIETEDINFTSQTGEKVNRQVSRSLPTKFYGVVELVQGDGSFEGPETKPEAAPSGVDPTLIPRLKLLAKTKPYEEFVDEAYHLPGVEGNDTMLSALADEEGLYKQLKES